MNDAAAAKTAEREIVVTRVIDAPRELVWDAWRDPASITHWWGPHGFSTTTEKMDFRPGCQWAFVMHGPDGKDYPNTVTYVEIVEPERIVYKHSGDDGSRPIKFDAIVTFVERSGKTELTLRMIFDTPAEYDYVAKEHGALEGAYQTLERLEEQLGMAADREIVVSRIIDAPRELVWNAWRDPASITHWWGPRGFSTTTEKMEFRPGGQWVFVMHGLDGKDYPNIVTYVEIATPERIVYKHSCHDGDAIVTFAKRGEKTELILRMVFATVAERDNKVKDGVLEGGCQTLERLEEQMAMSAKAGAFVISRTFDAPRDLMWKVWTECEHLRHWWGPKGFKVTHCKIAPRPGALFHYRLESPQGQEMWGRFVFREVLEPERLVFLSSFSDPEGGVTVHPMAPAWPRQMLSEVTFTEADGKTTVTVRWTPYEATEEERETFEAGRPSMQAGWTGTFEQLEAHLIKAVRD